MMKDYSIFLKNHPEAKEILGLVGKLVDAGIPVYFNAEYDYDLDKLDELAAEDGRSIWDDFDLLIETQDGELVDEHYAPVSAEFDGETFLVRDAVSGTEYRNPTQEEAFQVFKNYIDSRNVE
ncbi:MAG: hypothetical protein NC541_11095 [bacterium]|nr:hypothetical protein [bacterium]MCM1542647.1 hypothetical protein [Blautia sp.]